MRNKNIPLTIKLPSVLLLLFLPLYILSVITGRLMLADARKTLLTANQTVLQNYITTIDDRISNSNYMLYNLIQNDEIFLKLIQEKDPESYRLTEHRLYVNTGKQLNTSQSMDMLLVHSTLFDRDIAITKSGSDIQQYAQTVREDILARGYEQAKGWLYLESAGLPYLLYIYDYSGCQIAAVIDLSSYLSAIDESFNYHNYSLAFSDALPEKSQSETLVSSSCRNAPLNLFIEVPISEQTALVDDRRYALFLLLLSYILLFPILYQLLRHWILQPLHILRKAQEELRIGHENYRITESASSPEFQKTFDTYNEMADSLQLLTQEKIEKETSYNRMLLNNLQLQIRPHFLLNTFNMIFTLVKTQKTDAAATSIIYLSDYFRNLFQHTDDLVIFQKEHQLLKEYLEIAAFQHPGRFTYTEQIDPEIEMVRIPPLLVHNFVENIISHALVSDRVVNIMFQAFYEDQRVTFLFIDNGCGMPQEQVDQINHYQDIHLNTGLHLGIRNSISRLKFFYHDQAQVSCESTLGEGTIFTITFPYNLD